MVKKIYISHYLIHFYELILVKNWEIYDQIEYDGESTTIMLRKQSDWPYDAGLFTYIEVVLGSFGVSRKCILIQ